MKKFLHFLIVCCIFKFAISITNAQVICIMCYDQNDSISTGVNNLIINGGFETTPCPASTGVIGSATSFCPNSVGYVCDLANWTCTGGGASTYACIYNQVTNKSMVEEGSNAVYMGNFYCNACSNSQNDTSCLVNNGCTVSGPPVGFPNNPDPSFGGSIGVSIEQTVNGLTPLTTYILEFWAGGEQGMFDPGLFAVNVGFGDTMLRTNQTPPGTGIGIRYLVEFKATSTSHTIKFTNWGHICTSCTELVLDDVRLYTLAELNPAIPPCANSTPVAAFTGPNHICPGTCTDFTNLSSNGLTYIWDFPGGNPSVSTDVNPTGICYNTPGNYPVTLIANGANGGDTLTLNNYITVYPFPAAQGISQNGDTLFANQGAVSYQWYQDGILIPGATNYFYVATMSGNFNVVATDANNCEVEAVIFDVIAGIGHITSVSPDISIYPNPVNDELFVHSTFNQGTELDVFIYNVLGTQVMNVSSRNRFHLDVSGLPPGVYDIEIIAGTNTFRSKFVKE
jgi:PKD repeat protein